MLKLTTFFTFNLLNFLNICQEVNKDYSEKIDCDKFIELELHNRPSKYQFRYFKERRLSNYYFIGFPSNVLYQDDNQLQSCRAKIANYLKLHDQRFVQINEFISYIKNILDGGDQKFDFDMNKMITCQQQKFLENFLHSLQLTQEQYSRIYRLLLDIFKISHCVQQKELSILDYMEFQENFSYQKFLNSNYFGDFFDQYNSYEYFFKYIEFQLGAEQTRNYKYKFQFQKKFPQSSQFINIDPSLKSQEKIQYIIKLGNKILQNQNKQLHKSFLNLLFSQYANQDIQISNVSDQIEFQKLIKRFNIKYDLSKRLKFQEFSEEELQKSKHLKKFIFENSVIESSEYIPMLYYQKKKEYKNKSMSFRFIAQKLRDCYFYFLRQDQKNIELDFYDIIYCSRLLNNQDFQALHELEKTQTQKTDQIIFDFWFLTLRNKFEYFVEWGINLKQIDNIETVIYLAFNQVPEKVAQLQNLLIYNQNQDLQLFLNFWSLISYDFENAGFLFQMIFASENFKENLQKYSIKKQDKIDLYYTLAEKIICPVCIFELINLGQSSDRLEKLKIYYLSQNTLNYQNLIMIYFAQTKQFIVKIFKKLINLFF